MKRRLFTSNPQRTLLITFIALASVLFHLHRTSAQTSALASLAASMQSGTWAELQTSNLNATFSSSDAGGGASGQIIGYTDDAVWDPASRQVFFLGGDHNWSVPTTVKFVSYSEATNSWQRRPTPSWASGVVHGYHHNAIDTATGTFYHRPFSVQVVHRYNISSQTWDQPAMAAFPFTSDYNNCCDAFEYFPELGGLVWVSGSQSVYLYRPSTNQWSTLATNLNIGGTWHSARYNPVRQVMIFYSEMTGALYKLSSSGQVTRLGNPPISLYNSLVGPLTVDPVSGKYLALTPNGSQFYTYDVQTDVWQAQSTSTKPSFDPFIVATPISTYGVNMFVSCANGAAPCHVYLYKFSGGSPPPPPPPGDTTPPTVSVSSPAAGSTVSATTTVSANASDNVGVAGVQFKLDGANLGAEDTTSPYSVSWNTTTASNGSHTLTAVARDAAGNQATSASVTVTVSNAAPTFDFSLANGGNRTAVQGQSASNTVTATLVSGTAASVSFSASGLPSGATASFSPASCLPTCTSTLTISTSASTPTATSTITVTGTSGSLSHTTAFTLTVSAAASSSFTQKCAQTGVLNCFSFDSTSSLYYAWPSGTQCDAVFAGQTNNGFGLDRSGPGNTVAVIQNGQCVYPQIDTTNPHSGAGSLKFTIPSNSSANSSGYFAEPFKRYADGTFPYIGPGSPLGSVVYFQFYQKVDPNFVGTNYLCTGGDCSGWKQVIWYGNPPNGSSSSLLESTMINGWQRGVPQMYGQQGSDDYGIEDVAGCTYAKATSQGGSGSGFNSQPNYSAPLNPTCAHYPANQWVEFTGRLEIRGTANSPSSRIQLWVNGQLVLDYGAARVDWSGPDGTGYGQFLMSPYHTNKDPNQAHPVGYTWFDDLIISTQPIAMGSGSPPPSDTTPPTVSISSPATGSTVSGTITATSTASDNVGVVGVQYKLDGANLGAEDTASPYSTSWNTTSASNGSHTLTAVARDAAGNRTTSSPVTVTVSNTTPDTTPPTVSITNPANGSTVSGTITATSTASDNVGVVGVQYKLDGVNLGAEDTASPYSTSWNTTSASNGSHTLTAVARDAAGNSTTSSPVAVTVSNTTPDTTPPTVSITSPANGSTVSGTITATSTASDNVGVVGVQYKLDGANLGAEDTASPYSTSWNTTSASNGSHTLTAVARDAAGNSTTSSPVTVTVSNTTPDTTPPTVSITSPANGSTVSGTITATSTASDNVGVVGVQYKLDGANLGAEDTASPYSTNWNTTTASNGSHTLTAVARDAAGNRTTSAAVTVTVSNTAPDTTPPAVSITSPANGTTVSSTITASATASDNVAVVGVQFKLDGANYGAEDTTSPYSTSWNTTTVSNGSHTLTAIARDAAGNQTTSSPVAVTVSNSAAGPAKWTGSGRINVPGGLGYFGFFITRAADGTLSGQLEYYFDGTGFDFDAPNMLTLTVTGNKAVITGTGMERFGNGAWSGPYNFTATVQDLGTSGTTDTFKIQISDPGATSAGSDTTTLIYGNIVKYY